MTSERLSRGGGAPCRTSDNCVWCVPQLRLPVTRERGTSQCPVLGSPLGSCSLSPWLLAESLGSCPARPLSAASHLPALASFPGAVPSPDVPREEASAAPFSPPALPRAELASVCQLARYRHSHHEPPQGASVASVGLWPS